jgi:uncharacterized protein YkwD
MAYVVVHSEKRFSYSKARRRAAWGLLAVAALAALLYFAPIDIPKTLFKPEASEVRSPSATATPQLSGIEAAKAAFAEINALRAQNGLAPIQWDDNDYALAVWRSRDMVTRRYFDHTTPEGVPIGHLLNENAAGTGNPGYSVELWKESPRHLENLLGSGHIYGAVGCYVRICAFIGTVLPGVSVEEIRKIYNLP